VLLSNISVEFYLYPTVSTVSRRWDPFRWSAVFRRCRRRRRLTLVHRLPPRHDFDLISDHRRRERCSSDHRRFFLNPAQHDILPHRQSQLSDLTIILHITTSLKSITQIRCSKWCFHQFNFLNPSRDQSFFVLIGQIAFRYGRS